MSIQILHFRMAISVYT